MNLGSVIGMLGNTTAPVPAPAGSEKTASTNPAATSDAVDRASLAALEALRPASEKTAGVAGAAPAPAVTPVDALRQHAEKVAGLEKSAELAFADQLGTTFADAAIRRIGEHTKAAETLLGIKTASDVTADEIAMIKMARENPRAFLAEVERGYLDGVARQKTARDASYDRDFLEATRGIHNVACRHYLHGYEKTASLVKAAASR